MKKSKYLNNQKNTQNAQTNDEARLRFSKTNDADNFRGGNVRGGNGANVKIRNPT